MERKNETIRALLQSLLDRPVCLPDPQAEDPLARQCYACEMGSQALANRVYTAFYRQLAAHGLVEQNRAARPFAQNDTVFYLGQGVTGKAGFQAAMADEGFRALLTGALQPRPNDQRYDHLLDALTETAQQYDSLLAMWELIRKGSELG